MKYREDLIQITDRLCDSSTMYSMILLRARSLTVTLSGYRCFLDGKYILCLNSEDTVSVHGGYCEAVNLRFLPSFYNVNLNHELIGMGKYDEMREKYGYPDFRFFRMRGDDYFGIVSLSDEEYDNAELCFSQAKRNLGNNKCDDMWSCRTRSEIISLLQIVDAAYMGKQSGLGNEILRYIHDNISSQITLEALCRRFNTNRTTIAETVKEKTGLPPIKYLLEVRLKQSRPDLLFTELPVREIAVKYGFANPNYYIRAFKKRFGISPLKFRKEGLEARRRDLGRPDRPSLSPDAKMTAEEFRDYFRKGLGRAIILLKQQADKEPFKEVFLDCVFGSVGLGRSLGVYEKEIIDIFDDEGLRAEIEARAFEDLEGKMAHSAFVPVMILFGHRERVEEIIERRYRESYAQLLEYTKKPWDGEKYPPFARVYMAAAATIGRCLKAGDARIKRMLFDIADLFEYCEHPVVPTWQNPLFCIWDGVGEHFFVILDEVVKEHKNGRLIDIRNEMVRCDQAEIPPAAEEILSQKRWAKDNWWMVEGFGRADEETVRTVAAALISDKDMSGKLYLLQLFTIPRHDEKRVEFPLDVEPLIEFAKRSNYDLDSPHVKAVLQILTNKRCPAAREVGAELLKKADSTGALREYACEIRFGKNYISELDREDFAELLCARDETDRIIACNILIVNLRNGVEGLPLEVIPEVFSKIDNGWSRFDLCKALCDRGLMPEVLKEECRYDSNGKVRDLFVKIPKPEHRRAAATLFPPETAR